VVPGVNLKHLVVLYPPDTSDHFVEYIKDDRKVFYNHRVVKGADAASFRVVSGKNWDAEDQFNKYQYGERLEQVLEED
jgi:hypothetical protein